MFKKITPKEKITRIVNEQHWNDNYLTKEITPNISLSIGTLEGNLETETKTSERVYYFISGKAEFLIEGETVLVQTGDVLYIPTNTQYSAIGEFKAITVNTPAYGVKK